MNKTRYLFLIFMLITISARSQIFDPAVWNFGYEDKGNNVYEIIITATIDEGSHIYSMDIPEGGPIPTSIRFDRVFSWTPEGDSYEVTGAEEIFDEAFGMKIKSFSNKAEFRQKIRGNVPAFTVTGAVNYMACNNVTCSPPKDVEFEINIMGVGAVEAAGETLPPEGKTTGRGLTGFLLVSMLAGFAGILTPCVFPMIPMTVAFFSHGSEKKGKSALNAIIFGLSIILIYTALGLIVSLSSAGAGFANTLSTHWIPNILFFSLFVIFAISFLGAFEITLPNTWVTGADSRVDRGGIFAAFFMGLTTVIVSFSCTGPIVGALLVEAATGDVFRPVIGMFGFGLAFAMPFTLFALFPSVLKKMPASGGWLNSVKVVLGFIMLAFSFKFLSVVDSVYNFGLISRDVFLIIWIVLFSLLGFYLLGKIRFAHDSEVKHTGVFRFFLVVIVFSFVVYLTTGLFGNPLRGITAFLPSQESSWFSRAERAALPQQQDPAFATLSPLSENLKCQEPRWGDRFSLPYGLRGYFDYAQGLECAKKLGKPALLDFRGHACANCRMMEARVWSDPEVLRRLREDFVIIALYLDDRTQLPENEWIVSQIDGKTKKTIGKVNEDHEISRFRTNAMPLYVITDHQGNQLNTPMTTNLNVEEYRKWLDEGLKLFKERI
ncbi:MAG: disulfide bond formation protein DsbD [Bacteroidales bacterium]|nr:disulfide bond formation protein DsbD [Bacteroidales bacterium]